MVRIVAMIEEKELPLFVIGGGGSR